MLDNVLGNVVAVLVRNELRSFCVQLLENKSPCWLFTMLEHSLDNAASIRVDRETADTALESLDDELYMLHRDTLNSFLNDVVAILVLDAFQDIFLKLFHQQRLLVSQDVFQGLDSQSL